MIIIHDGTISPIGLDIRVRGSQLYLVTFLLSDLSGLLTYVEN